VQSLLLLMGICLNGCFSRWSAHELQLHLYICWAAYLTTHSVVHQVLTAVNELSVSVLIYIACHHETNTWCAWCTEYCSKRNVFSYLQFIKDWCVLVHEKLIELLISLIRNAVLTCLSIILMALQVFELLIPSCF